MASVTSAGKGLGGHASHLAGNMGHGRGELDSNGRRWPPPHHLLGRASAILGRVVPPARHLLRAKDLADGRYFEPLTVADLARTAGLSPAHFSREFRRTFGESPHQYLLTRRLERAAALLRNTDRPVTEICFAVGLASVGSFTTSFRRVYEAAPLAYRAAFPSAQRHIRIPNCTAQAYGRRQNRTFREAEPARRP
jgi:AraC-like DNA-binding protein